MLNLPNWLRRISPSGRKATKLYGSIVTQARDPRLYRDFAIPDTPAGRYEMVALHTVLVLLALRRIEGRDGPLGRGVVERFVTDMDDSLREMAVGDMSVPRKVKRAAAGLRERTQAYDAALLAKPSLTQLEQALSGFLAAGDDAATPTPLARYVVAADAALADWPDADLRAGEVGFPAPRIGAVVTG